MTITSPPVALNQIGSSGAPSSITDTLRSYFWSDGTVEYWATALQVQSYTLSGTVFTNATMGVVGPKIIGTSGVTATYDSNAKTVTIAGSGGAGYTDNAAKDAAAAIFTGGTNSGVTFTYDATAKKMTTTVTATGGGGTINILQPVVLTGSGKYLPPRGIGFANSGAASTGVTANTLYAYFFNHAVSLTALATNVATATTAGMKMALAGADGITGQPGTLLEAIATAQSMNTTGIVNFALTQNHDMNAQGPYGYYVLMISDGTPTLTGGVAQSATLGAVFGATGMSASTFPCRLKVDGFGFNTAIPSDLTQLTWVTDNTSGNPAICAIKTT